MLFRSFSNVCFYILVGSFPCRHLTVHAHQEFIVVFGFFQTVFYEVHCLYRVHIGKILAENPHAIQRLLVLQQVIATSAGSNDIDSGKMRLLDRLRSSCSSILPVPLNSSKITSSILEPVSISAVARMVSEPPPSMLRAAPKKRFGLCSALASTPPDNTLPEAGETVL